MPATTSTRVVGLRASTTSCREDLPLSPHPASRRARDRATSASASWRQHQGERGLPGPERTVSRPCMRSASSRAIARPSPAPCACSLEVKNGSKMCGMFWRLIPRPPSETSSRTCPLKRAAETRTPVPGGVWRSALSSRIRSTWATRSGSQSSSIGSGRRSSVTSDSCWAAAGVNSAATSRASWPTSVGSGRSSSAPASSRERSSSSTARLRIRSTWPRICSRNARRVSSSRSSSASSSRKPPREKIGVRSSCDALAMNCLRARSSRASCACMSSNAAASRPSSSSESARIGCEKSPAATLRAARSSRLTRADSARATR